MSITLEDVEVAIKILQIFLKKQREAETVLRRFQQYERRAISRGFSMEDFMSMALETVKSKKQIPEIMEPEEISEEDIKRIREIAKNLEEKK